MSRVRLRGHHLLCLRTFAGEGYDAGFLDNLRSVLARAEAEGAVLVVDGADDVCAACPTLGRDGRCEHQPEADADIRALDALALELLGARAGDVVRLGEPALSGEAAARWLAEACVGCEWEIVCVLARGTGGR